MDPFTFFDHIRSQYPQMSAVGLIGAGIGLGWVAAWLLLQNQIATYKTRLEHAQDVIGGKAPSATYKPIRFRTGRSMIAGLVLLVCGLLTAIIGTAFIFWNMGDNTPTRHPSPSTANANTTICTKAATIH
jgi:hypothetical protein